MTFRAGQWNVICDRCGQKFKSGQLRKEWTGLMVCEEDFEPRHPQDFVRAVALDKAPYPNRPIGEHVYLSPGDVTADDL